MNDTPENPGDQLARTGESICRGRDWRWVVLWAYNLHRLLRPAMKKRQVWEELDALIRAEWDWHLGGDLFRRIRQDTLAQENDDPESAEHAYLLLGEVAAKCASNASWRPGLFDYNCAWQVPTLALRVADRLGDRKQAYFLRHHFTSLASNRYSDSPSKP